MLIRFFRQCAHVIRFWLFNWTAFHFQATSTLQAVEVGPSRRRQQTIPSRAPLLVTSNKGFTTSSKKLLVTDFRLYHASSVPSLPVPSNLPERFGEDAEAQSLSRACAALKGDVAAGRRREEALEQRAKQAEAR